MSHQLLLSTMNQSTQPAGWPAQWFLRGDTSQNTWYPTQASNSFSKLLWAASEKHAAQRTFTQSVAGSNAPQRLFEGPQH